jgi:hypothetical protein
MSIGLSLLTYIGSKALVGYDQDYTHWSNVQLLAEYLEDNAKIDLRGTHLQITPNLAGSSAMADSNARPVQAGLLKEYDPNKAHIVIDIPQEDVERVKAILAYTDPNSEPVDFSFACTQIIAMFAKAQHKQVPPDDQPVVKGGITANDCRAIILKEVPPRVIKIAADLASTYSSISGERATLDSMFYIISTPARLFNEWFVRPFEWSYDRLFGVPREAFPDKPSTEDFSLTTGDEINLFVFQQQRHTPMLTILPIPSVVFNARLIVAITNTYLLTLSFGFLGACVWVLREINLRLENFTLAPSRFPRYLARILLGMVAGPTIGLFFDQGHLLSFTTTSSIPSDAPSLSKHLSMAAIAFVAGYSIEILFALLERLIKIIQEFAGANDSHPSVAR